MELRLQRLAQAGIALALGAIMMGVVGLIAAWIGDGGSSHIALILIGPGGLMVAAAAYMMIGAIRTEPDAWQPCYQRSVYVLQTAALLAFVATIATAVFVHGDAPAPQILLIAFVGLQGPIAMYLVTRQLSRALRS